MIVVDVGNLRVHDAPLHDDRSLTELESQIVQRVEVQRKARFNESAAEADLPDHHRLKHHDLALESADHGDSSAVALFVRH